MKRLPLFGNTKEKDVQLRALLATALISNSEWGEVTSRMKGEVEPAVKETEEWITGIRNV